MARLRRVDPRSPGLTRRRQGRGFVYVDSHGERIRDPDVLARIEALVLPPAWQDVWICAAPNGHIQATGVDAAGRRQYRYHDDWRLRRDRAKHDRVLEVAAVLPDLRDSVAADLGRQEPDRACVLSLAVRLLDLGFFRIGEDRYASTNGTFGLTTLRREHVTVTREGTLVFDYLAKGGKQRHLELSDRTAARVVTTLKRRRDPGRRLLAYRRPGGGWTAVVSRDVNEYLREATGLAMSAKDFRTWHATVLMAVALAMSTEAVGSPTARSRAVARAVSEVAHYLGNTPAVCRRSYIDPRVIDRFNDGETIRPVIDRLSFAVDPDEPATRGPIEEAVRQLLAG